MIKTFLLFLCIACITTSCSEDQRSTKFGGTKTIKLEPQEKFINISWKQNNLWVIVQDTITGDIYAREKSATGLMEGKIIIKK